MTERNSKDMIVVLQQHFIVISKIIFCCKMQPFCFGCVLINYALDIEFNWKVLK